MEYIHSGDQGRTYKARKKVLIGMINLSYVKDIQLNVSLVTLFMSASLVPPRGVNGYVLNPSQMGRAKVYKSFHNNARPDQTLAHFLFLVPCSKHVFGD